MMTETDLIVYRGDITLLHVDAVVNAANSGLAGGGGVDGAIHRAAGPELLQACRKLGGCPTGQVKMTPAFKLPAKAVLHAVGPVWQGGLHQEAELLASCYRHSMRIVTEQRFVSVAFPAISCGVYGYPLSQAVDIAVREVKKGLAANPQLQQVIFCCFDEVAEALYQTALNESS